MQKTSTINGFLSSNFLKIFAAITMTIDHVGYILFPQITWLRIVGRLAFPIFAFLIAEGCKYTRNKLKYFLMVFLLGVFCQIFAYFFGGQTKLNILFTFSFSIGLVYLLMWFKNSIVNKNKKQIALSAFAFVAAVIGTFFLTSNYLSSPLVNVDYGFWGIMVAVFVSVFDKHWLKVFMLALCLIILCLGSWYLQWFCLLSVVLVWFYNGQRGKNKLKYFFYAYYPLHLAVIYIIALIV